MGVLWWVVRVGMDLLRCSQTGMLMVHCQLKKSSLSNMCFVWSALKEVELIFPLIYNVCALKLI